MAKLWGGRFSKKNDPLFERFSSSYRWDVRLLPHDLAIDLAHVEALKGARVLTAAEANKLTAAIRTLEKKRAAGKLRLDPNAEDIHSAVQEQLAKLAGPLADKIHTGRSRNDLVSQSSRLYCKEHLTVIRAKLVKFQKSIVGKASEYRDVLIPGMTHLQNAQVLSVAHIFLAYVEMLERAKRRVDLAIQLCDVCVLGSGALAGTTFALDQKKMARRLGLSSVTTNSYDVSGDRDFALNTLSTLSFLGTGLSRIAEDLMLGQTKGFSIYDIDQAYCTGSSMMPQKKNADFIELARSAVGVFNGNFVGLLSVVKGLPTSYNRDLQWDKHFLFDSVEQAEDLLELFARAFATLKVNTARARELVMDDALYATDLADYLVKKGVPFKTAHHQVGQIVSFAEEKQSRISRLPLATLKQFAPAAGPDVFLLFDPEHSVRLKRTVGSTHPARVASEIAAWRKKLK